MTKDEALNIAIDYMNERLEEHDAKFQRHPVAEAERNNILADIEAVKEALAQQDSKDKEQAKTDSFVRQLDEALAQPEQLISDQINYGMSVTQGGKRIDPMSIYKEPEQKPVAEVDDWRDSIFTRYVEYLPSGTRLYTTPLEPKPMTDEEIDKMCPKFEDPMRREMWIIGFKAAHGIKGEA